MFSISALHWLSNAVASDAKRLYSSMLMASAVSNCATIVSTRLIASS